MKKNYETPSIEKVAFQYRDQVVVASGHGGSCTYYYSNDHAASDSKCVQYWDGPSA